MTKPARAQNFPAMVAEQAYEHSVCDHITINTLLRDYNISGGSRFRLLLLLLPLVLCGKLSKFAVFLVVFSGYLTFRYHKCTTERRDSQHGEQREARIRPMDRFRILYT